MTGCDVIRLAGATPLARGYERAVYDHPTNPHRVLKVLVANADQLQGGRARRFFSAHMPDYRQFLIRQEYYEYARAALTIPVVQARFPLSHMFGFVETDLGLACVSEKVSTPDGTPAPTLRALSRQQSLKDDHIAALSDFARRLLRYEVRCSDLTRSNIVFGHRQGASAQGPFEAVLIDGFGDTHGIPIRRVSRQVNTWAIHRKLGKIGGRIGHPWDSSEQTFR